MGSVADLFHHGNGKRTRGHHVAHCRSGHRAHKSRGHHRGFGRTAGKTAGKGIGQFDEKIPAARRFQKGAEKNEYEHKGGRHPDGQAEDPFGGQPQRRCDAFDGIAFVDDQFGHPGAEMGVEHGHHADPGHDPADHAPAGFQDQQGADNAHQPVRWQPIPLAFENSGQVEADVGRAINRSRHQQPVEDHPSVQTILARPGIGRFEQKGQHQDRAQVNGSLDQGREGGNPGGIKLVEAEGDGHHHNDSGGGGNEHRVAPPVGGKIVVGHKYLYR